MPDDFTFKDFGLPDDEDEQTPAPAVSPAPIPARLAVDLTAERSLSAYYQTEAATERERRIAAEREAAAAWAALAALFRAMQESHRGG